MDDINKGLNKKGQQEGLGLGTILALIVGVVALVVIVVGTTMGFGQFFSLFKLAPNDLTKMAAACKTYSGNEALKLSYCQFNEGTIEGKKGFYNCDYIWTAADKSLEGGPGFDKLGICDANVALTKCSELKDAKTPKWESVIVNGQACGTVSGLA